MEGPLVHQQLRPPALTTAVLQQFQTAIDGGTRPARAVPLAGIVQGALGGQGPRVIFHLVRHHVPGVDLGLTTVRLTGLGVQRPYRVGREADPGAAMQRVQRHFLAVENRFLSVLGDIGQGQDSRAGDARQLFQLDWRPE